MSRVLRRPMFRGGIANSEGTGITSGLENQRQGYKDGSTDVGVQEPLDYGLNDYYENLYTPQVRRPITQLERLEQIKAERQQPVENFGINPKTGLPFTPRDRLNLEPSIIDIARKEGIDLRKGTAREQVEATKLFEKNLADKKAQELKDKALKNNKNNEPFVKENTTVKNLPSFYDEYISMINKANLVDQDELTKQKYLELAKFGLNLMGQPGGAPGGKRDLFGAISRAAEKPLEGYSNILSRESQMKQLPKQLALQAAINAMAPGQLEKNIQGLINAGLSSKKALEFVTKEGTYQQRIQDREEQSYYSPVLERKFNLKNPTLQQAASKSFVDWLKIDSNLNIGQISPIPADTGLAIDKKYYIDPNTGVIVKFDKKINNYREAGEI